MEEKIQKSEKKFNDAFETLKAHMSSQGIEITKEDFIKKMDAMIEDIVEKDNYSTEEVLSTITNLTKILISPEELDKHIKDWTEQNRPLGESLGYPECCIKEFCSQPPILLNNSIPTNEDQIRYDSACIDGDFTGFIPCTIHAKQIKEGKIKLASLIKDRDIHFAKFPFALK